ADEIARHLPRSEEWPGLAGPAPVPPAHAFDDATAAADAGDQAVAIARVVRHVSRSGLRVAGTHQVELAEDAVVNTQGVSAYAPSTMAYPRALVQSDVGSGFAEDLAGRSGALDPEGVAERAAEKCVRDRDRTMLEPGDYEAILEELAVAEILRVVSLAGLG